jgi:hypothetical protein
MDAGIYWAKYHYTKGAVMIDQVLNAVRMKDKITSCLQFL